MPTTRPGTSPDDLAIVAAIGAELNHDLAGLVDGMRGELAARITELDGDPVLLELLGASIEGNVDTILHALQHHIEPGRFEPPTAAFEYARRLAQRGVPVNALVRAYRLGHQYLLTRAFEAGERLVDPDRLARPYAVAADTMFAYIDWISQRVVTVYENEREAWLANQRNEREARVRGLLAGDHRDLDQAERLLGYRLRGRHVAAVSWLSDAATSDQLTRSARALRMLARHLGSPQVPLVVGQDENTTWAWIQVPAGCDSTAGLASWSFDQTPAPAIALSSVHEGVDGFRVGHEEAVRVQRVALLGDGPARQVLSHDEPGTALATLLSDDLAATRRFVRRVLGGLAADDETAARQRSTLLVFLRHDFSYTATADAMAMHKNSVRYRVATAEKVLGRGVRDGRLDLEVALGLAQRLGSAVLG
ncbi:PucR family transcriptional regulator [Nocardioides zeae]